MIGSSLAIRLVQYGASVKIADNRMPPYGANDFNIREIREKVEVFNVDIRDRQGMTPLVQQSEIIFNLAGQVSHNDSMNNPMLDTEINYIGHLNVMEIVKKENRDIRMIHAGSRLQYGPIHQLPVPESHPQEPLTPYSLNKSAAENMYLFYHRIHGIPVVLFRIANPYGPRGQMRHLKYCIVNWFLRQAMEGGEITVFGEGNQIRDYIYIDDLVCALALAGISNQVVGQILNVGSGKGTRFIDMVDIILKTTGSGCCTKVPWPDDYINVETGNFVADISRIQSLLDWKPRVSLEEGIRRTHEYYRLHFKHYVE
ncbi:MAG TPA: NAD-dependent epimerase/dehydratase family protein [Desulfobacteraceae bacterium]|nr:NAD-dependent epimerase/dehydratase family protein [Desulfobacteraceae bacterium]